MTTGAVLVIVANIWVAGAVVIIALAEPAGPEPWWIAVGAAGIGVLCCVLNAQMRVQEIRHAAWPEPEQQGAEE